MRVPNEMPDGTPIVDGDVFTNTARGYTNEENLITTLTEIPAAPDFFWSNEQVRNVTVAEPEFTISKTATPSETPTDQDSTITYSITARNTTGRAIYDARIFDVPGASLENITLGAAPGGTVAVRGWTEQDPTLEWFIPQWNNNVAVTFTYTAEVADDYVAENITTADNNAWIEGGSIFNRIDPEPGDRQYGVHEEASTSTALSSAFVEVEKSIGGCDDDFNVVAVNEPVTWCVQVANTGSAVATNVAARDIVPAGWTYVSGSATISGVAQEPNESEVTPGSVLLVWELGDIEPATQIEMQYQMLPSADSDTDIVNRVSVESRAQDGSSRAANAPGTRSSDTASARIADFGLEISKIADEQQFGYVNNPGAVDWDIVVTNPTNEDLTNVVIVDSLPSPLTYVAGSATSDYDPTVHGTDPSHDFAESSVGVGSGSTTAIEWTVPSLAANTSFTISVSADAPGTVDEFAWHINDVAATSTEVIDPAVDQARVRFYEPASLGGVLWNDENGDGLNNADESTESGQVVSLLNGAGNQLYLHPTTGLISVIDQTGFDAMTTTTGSNGEYSFTNLPAGDYSVEFAKPAGTEFTWRDVAGSNDSNDSDVNATGRSHIVSLDSGEDDMSVDAGLTSYGSVAGLVWVDEALHGVRTADEANRLAGVSAILSHIGADGLPGTADDVAVDSTQTDVDGSYAFAEVPLGEYVVALGLDASIAGHNDLYLTVPDYGTNDAIDSDFGQVTATSELFALTSEAPNVTDLDAGYVVGAPVDLGDRVWLDVDADGIQDSDESGVANVTVNLLYSDGTLFMTTTTDADGHYVFPAVPAVDYIIEVVAPNGHLGTFPNVGADPEVDSNVDPATGRSAVFSTAAGVADLTRDAGLVAAVVDDLAELAGVAWIDTDFDGLRSDVEGPVDGVVVSLYHANGTVVATATTNAVGEYEFLGLLPGDYTVGFSLDQSNPAHDDLVATRPNVGADDTVDSDLDRIAGTTELLTLGAGSRVDTVDAGWIALAAPAELSGQTWIDENGNGIQDLAEPSMLGVIVRLADAFGVVDEVTAANGQYLFANLPPGPYSVEFIAPNSEPLTFYGLGNDDAVNSDADPASNTTPLVSLAAGDAMTDIDAGYLLDQVGSLGGVAWIDASNDGTRSLEEPSLSGVTVALLNSAGVTVVTEVTGADGSYLFENLPSGTYSVEFDLDPASADHVALTPTRRDAGVDTADSDIDRLTGATGVVLVAGGDDVRYVDAGFIAVAEPASIQGVTWEDENNNGRQDSTEPLVAGTVVRLVDEHGLVEEFVTADGTYLFENLPEGEYVVEFVKPSSYAFTFTNIDEDASDDIGDSDADRATGRVSVMVPGNADIGNVDAGLLLGATGSLGNRVWLDINGNGRQDDGEDGVSEITLRLYDASTDTELASTLTQQVPAGGTSLTVSGAGEGWYEFANLPAGSYYVIAEPIEDRVFTWPLLGSAREGDSNADRETGRSDTVVLGVGQQDVRVDFGVAASAQIDGTLWDDANANDERDESEIFANIGVWLLDADGGVLASTTTNEDGYYAFFDIPEGVYALEIAIDELPENYSAIETQTFVPNAEGVVIDVATRTDAPATVDVGFAPDSLGAPPFALAFTGSNPLLATAIAMLLLIIGFALAMGSRRSRRL